METEKVALNNIKMKSMTEGILRFIEKKIYSYDALKCMVMFPVHFLSLFCMNEMENT